MSNKKNPLFNEDELTFLKVFFSLNLSEKGRPNEPKIRANEKIISTGANLSYSPLSFDKNNISILLKKFNRIIKFNPKKKKLPLKQA